MRHAALFCLLSFLAAYGQSRYFRVVEGDQYEFWHQDTFSVGGTGPSHSTTEGKLILVVSDVHQKGDSLRFTLQGRDSTHSICDYSPANCLGFIQDRIRSFSFPLLYARGVLFIISSAPDSQERFSPYHNAAPYGSGTGVPRFLADTLPDRSDPSYQFHSVRNGNNGLKFTDPVDTAYYLAGFGPVYSKHWSSMSGFQTESEKFALIALNDMPFHLEDYFTVADPVPIREYSHPKRSVNFHFPNIDLLGRRIAIPDPAGRGPLGGFLFR
jgi:hypothetical protein